MTSKVRKVISSILAVVLVLALLPFQGVEAEAKAAGSTIYWDDVRQEIDGFGASGAFQQAKHLMNFPEPKRQEILDLLFSPTKGAGFSIVRNMVGDGGINEWGNEIDGPTPTIWPKEDGPFVWTGDEDQVWLMNQAKNYGVDQFVSTVWSPPAWMKTTNSVIRGGEVREDKYQQYADYLSAYIRGYKEHHGIDITGISLANEPDFNASYSSSRWTGEQFTKFINNHLTPTFEKDKITSSVILGEAMAFKEDPHIVLPVLEDEKARERVDIVAAHAYGGDRGMNATFPTVKKYGKKLWETETSNLGTNDPTMKDGLYWAKLLHNHMTVAEANAWFYWWFVSFKMDKGEPLINLDIENKEYHLNKRLFTIGNYSRFVRPGYNRISTSNTEGTGISVSAYKDEKTGEYAIVAINENDTVSSLDLNFDGFNATMTTDSVTPYRTSETEDLKQLDKISVVNGNVTTELAPKSVTTFVGKASDVKGKVLSPIKRDEVNTIKQGSKLPVKLELTDSEGKAITNAEAKLYVAEVSNGEAGTEAEAASPGKANKGNLFRYDENAGHYLYSFDSKPFSKGTYRLRIDIGGHTVDNVELELR
ncbi:PxKF domain-containing protein [Mesobacillus foraminis]|uniref:glycoside hydrolase n=1 Tax=Mesobacillus foraminis TaxID=279826 RepID=UPI001BEA8459|nr:glycoside hydrolase [Mesobacillus foraminis]MBT2757616.1 PxKF domain-containing protein [Mesobacillus foraminis]